MKKLITFSLFILFGLALQCQQLISEIGRVSTVYDYQNSENQSLGNLYSVSDFSYKVGYRLTLSEMLFLQGGFVFNRYINEGSDVTYDNYYKWETNYLGINISPEFQFLNLKKFRILAKGNLSPQFMVKGTQTINNQLLDLKGVEQFDSPFIFLGGGLGANYCLDDKVALSLNYNYNLGSPFGKSNDGELLKLRTSTFTIGLLWGFKTCKYCADKRH